MSELAIGDVVQIAPDAQVNRTLQGQLAYVMDVRSWGVQVGVSLPSGASSHAAHTGLAPQVAEGVAGETVCVAFTRVSVDHYVRVGRPNWMPAWVLE